MADTLIKAERELSQIRNECNRRAWFVSRIRESCGVADGNGAPAPRLLRDEADEEAAEILEIEAYLVAQRFHQLEEPGRSALALFYLDAFTTEEIAKLLRMTEVQLADTLADGRLRLQRLLRASQS